VQVVDVPEFTLVGLQASAETRVGAIKVNVAVWEEPLRVAVTVADWLVVMVPTVDEKVAVVLLADTVTDAATGSAALLEESATVLPPAGAAWFRVAVQVLVLPEGRLEGLHWREAKPSGATKVSDVVRELPPSEPVITAVCVVVKVPDVAVKPAAVCPAVTSTEAGTVSAASLDDNVMVAPD